MYFGLDFIYDSKSREWRLIEINARPVGVAASYILRTSSPRPDPVDIICNAIKSKLRQNDRVACIVPERYTNRDLFILNDLERPGDQATAADENIELLVQDVRAFRKKLGSDVVCLRFAEFDGPQALRSHGAGFVINYTTSRLSASTPTFNTYAACELARDKFATFLFLHDQPMVDTYVNVADFCESAAL